MIGAQERIRALRPDLVQRRGDRRLLVWAGPGAWLVADQELEELVHELDGRRPMEQVVRRLARRWGRAAMTVASEIGPALQALGDLGVVGPRPAPDERIEIANVTLNVTNRCNLRCRHCYNAPRGEEMPAAELAASLAASTGILSPHATLILLGGEPLLDLDRLETVVRGVADTFAGAPMLSSNGTLVDGSAAALLADLGVDVQLSLDGPTAAVNDPVRGEGSFARALAGAEQLVAAQVPLTLSMVYDATNLDQLEAYADLALALGAREVRFIPLRLIGRAAGDARRAPDQRLALARLLDLLDRRPEARRLLRRDFFTITREVCRRSGPRTSCGIGRRVVFVDADGAVYPCPNHRTPEMRCGHLAQTPLEQVVRESPGMVRVRRTFRVDRYERCGRCPVRPWCAGDCRGESVALHGRVEAPVPHCEEMRELIPELMWLVADGDPRLGLPADGGDFL